MSSEIFWGFWNKACIKIETVVHGLIKHLYTGVTRCIMVLLTGCETSGVFYFLNNNFLSFQLFPYNLLVL